MALIVMAHYNYIVDDKGQTAVDPEVVKHINNGTAVIQTVMSDGLSCVYTGVQAPQVATGTLFSQKYGANYESKTSLGSLGGVELLKDLNRLFPNFLGHYKRIDATAGDLIKTMTEEQSGKLLVETKECTKFLHKILFASKQLLVVGTSPFIEVALLELIRTTPVNTFRKDFSLLSPGEGYRMHIDVRGIVEIEHIK